MPNDVLLSFQPLAMVVAALLLWTASSAHAQSDPQATPQTKAVYGYLLQVSGKNILLGQQYPLHHAQRPARQGGNPQGDFFAAAGDYPAVWGSNWEQGPQVNRTQMVLAHAHRAICTMHLGMGNPATGGGDNDLKGNPGPRICPGGDLHATYCRKLDELADFFISLKDPQGRPIPVLLRVFPEGTGNWFWWGTSSCTPLQYKTIFRLTVQYLRDQRQVHQLLYVYAPSRPAETGDYSLRYPGDDVVDIIAFDHYAKPNTDFRRLIVADCRIVVEFAAQRGKVAAVAESGVHRGSQQESNPKWFTQQLLNPILSDPVARRVSYVLTWANMSSQLWWVPLRGQLLFDDFVTLTRHPAILLAGELPPDFLDAKYPSRGSSRNPKTSRGAR